MKIKNVLVAIGLVILLVAVPATVLLSKRIANLFGGAQQSPQNQFETQLDASVCPSDATCSPFNYYLDCVVFGHMVAKVVDISSGTDVDVTTQYNTDNRLRVESTHNPNTLWTVRLDSNLDNSLSCSDTGRTGAYFGNASCPSGGLLDGGDTYTSGKPVANTGYWCFNGPYNVKLASLPEGYELVSIDVAADGDSQSGQGGSVDLANKQVKDVNICNYNYGPGSYKQMTHNYTFKVRRTVANAKPLCNLKTVPSPAVGKIPLKVNFDGTGSTDSDGSITKYTWKIDGKDVSSQNKFDYTFDKEGEYSVTLVVNDNQNIESDVCSVKVTASKVAIVANKPECKIESDPENPGPDLPEEVDFDGSKSVDKDGSIKEWGWTIRKDGKDIKESNSDKFSYKFTEPGKYKIILKVKDNQDYESDECTMDFTLKEKSTKKTYSTCDYNKQVCVEKEGDQKSTCDEDSDCKPKPAVPDTGVFDNGMLAASVAAISLVVLGLLVIL